MNQEEHRREQSWQKRKLIVLTILFVMLQAGLLYAEANMMHAGRPIIIAGHAFTPFAIPGILAALKAIVCALLTVTDYRGTDQVIEVNVKGLEGLTRATATVLDDTRDNFPCEVSWRNGKLTLVKPDKNSSAWFVTFEND